MGCLIGLAEGWSSKNVSFQVLGKEVQSALPCGVLDAVQIVRLWQLHLNPLLLDKVRIAVHEGVTDACSTVTHFIASDGQPIEWKSTLWAACGPPPHGAFTTRPSRRG